MQCHVFQTLLLLQLQAYPIVIYSNRNCNRNRKGKHGTNLMKHLEKKHPLAYANYVDDKRKVQNDHTKPNARKDDQSSSNQSIEESFQRMA